MHFGFTISECTMFFAFVTCTMFLPVQAVNTMKLQPLEGLGMEEEDARPTVALSLVGRAGLPVLMIAGGKGSGVESRGEELEKELELMALPRSDAQERDDAQVSAIQCSSNVAVGGLRFFSIPHLLSLPYIFQFSLCDSVRH